MDKNLFDFTVEDYLESSIPYDTLADCYDGNRFTFRQKVELMRIDAAKKGIRAFMALWEAYCKSRLLSPWMYR